jgi:hypothetical protein
MRKLFSILALTSLLVAGLPASARAGAAFDLSISDSDGFYLGVSNYYGVPETRVQWIVRRGLPYQEVPVALYIAALADVDVYEVVDLRLSGWSWIDVCHAYGLGADIFYLPADPIGPYVSYYAPYTQHPRSAWVCLRLSDVAIVNLTDLRFTCQQYGVSARQIMGWRGRGENFLRIHRQLMQQRGRVPGRPLARSWARPQRLPDRLRLHAHGRTSHTQGAQPRSRVEAQPNRSGRPQYREQRGRNRTTPQARTNRHQPESRASSSSRRSSGERSSSASRGGSSRHSSTQLRTGSSGTSARGRQRESRSRDASANGRRTSDHRTSSQSDSSNHHGSRSSRAKHHHRPHHN